MDLNHGGDIGAAAVRFAIPADRWIDLSTGISPWSWPIPDIPQSVWQTLPYTDHKLEAAAAAYYGSAATAIVAVPGSQYALQFVPGLVAHGTVAIPRRGYAEHHAAWLRAGHQVVAYDSKSTLKALVTDAVVDHVVIINPNNPTGEWFARQELLELHGALQDRGGLLLVDEAFADTHPHISLAPHCPLRGLIVLRSLGKFFGLAGLRLGFMLGPSTLCQTLTATMPPWLISHPTRYLGAQALADESWQRAQRSRLTDASENWLKQLQAIIPALKFSATPLFISGIGEAGYCNNLYGVLAGQGILVRMFEEIEGQCMLRFGLPLAGQRELIVRHLREFVEEC